MTLKQKIHGIYLQQVNDKIDVFKDMILALTEDSKNDAKGSAGDKHETALSMMHIEQEKLNRKLAEIVAQKSILEKIDTQMQASKVSLGSLVQVNDMLLFVSTALPKITVEGKTIIAVSPQSPLGSKLMGSEVGFTFEINGSRYCISEIS